MRSGKFYRKNEKDVMQSLGLRPVPGSGSGWISKEDGENENILCQLKSTDKCSISVKKNDIDILVGHAAVSHKVPVFAVQFFQDESVWLMVRPSDLQIVCDSVNGNDKNNRKELHFDLTEQEENVIINKNIKPSSSDREKFYERREAESSRWKRKK